MNDELFEIYLLAKSKILLPGVKPEEYFLVYGNQEMPIKIAMMIVKEMRHIIKMNALDKQIIEKKKLLEEKIAANKRKIEL